MKVLYLDCSMGAAGDMLTAALLELLPPAEREAFLTRFNVLGLPGVAVSAAPAVKCGVTGTHVTVTVHGEEEDAHHTHDHHHHSGMEEITALVTALPLPEPVRRSVLEVYGRIAAAESAVHGVPVGQVHFHEVGALDAVADVTAVCWLLDLLKPDRIVASPVHVGSGQVRCAHGLLPVPAPATALLLRGVPTYGGAISGELCTPTGAALLTQFAAEFGPQPLMKVEKIGYGMGKKDFAAANCLRALLGESDAGGEEQVVELCCNLDDMTAEEIGFAADTLLRGGARDVYTLPLGMKKGRPGTLLCVLCLPEQRAAMTELLFRHTTTLGVRWHLWQRTVLMRRIETVETVFGPVRRKAASGQGVSREKWEYEDLARVAAETGLPLCDIKKQIQGVPL